MSPIDSSSVFFDRFPRLEHETESMYLFSCLSENALCEPPLAASRSASEPKQQYETAPLSSLFPKDSWHFIRRSMTPSDPHYILITAKEAPPLLVVTTLSTYEGLCLAVELRASLLSVQAFFRTMPAIRYLTYPVSALSCDASTEEASSAEFARLGVTFRRLFSFFEATYLCPSEYTDPFALVRLLRMKIQRAAELLGLKPHFLLQALLKEPMRPGLSTDLSLFLATVLLLLFSARRLASENELHIVFLSIDQCPAICVHFHVDSELYTETPPMKVLKKLYQTFGGYLTLCTGEHARKESEKIPGVGRMVQTDPKPRGDHALCVFSPIRRDFSSFVARSPIFRLPEDFYEGFPL